jgi:hypothetical protein
MSATRDDRIDQLEAEVTELRALVGGATQRRTRRGLLRRLALIGLVLALVIPAGVVLGGGQTFTDVPPSHKFFDDIEAIAAVGITSGCNATQYCPNGLVTRGQMAAFLNRLGALEAGSAPKVNADRLDGFHASAFSRAAYATMRPDECFSGPLSNRCSIYNVKGVDHIRRVSTGVYCVAPTAGSSFAGRTPSLTTDNWNSGPANGFGVPIVAYSSFHSICLANEVQVHTYRATGSGPTISASDQTSFGIVIP